MKGRFFVLPILALVFSLIFAGNVYSQNVDYGAILQRGERYIFVDNDDNIFPFIVFDLDNRWILSTIDWGRTSREHSIINGFIIDDSFSGSTDIPSYAVRTYSWLSHTTRDIYAFTLRDGGAYEYGTMIKVPNDFWMRNAFLDVGR